MSKELELVDQQKENLLGDDASAVDIPLPDPILTTQQVDFRCLYFQSVSLLHHRR